MGGPVVFDKRRLLIFCNNVVFITALNFNDSMKGLPGLPKFFYTYGHVLKFTKKKGSRAETEDSGKTLQLCFLCEITWATFIPPRKKTWQHQGSPVGLSVQYCNWRSLQWPQSSLTTHRQHPGTHRNPVLQIFKMNCVNFKIIWMNSLMCSFIIFCSVKYTTNNMLQQWRLSY